jgi:hypothetical protein
LKCGADIPICVEQEPQLLARTDWPVCSSSTGCVRLRCHSPVPRHPSQRVCVSFAAPLSSSSHLGGAPWRSPAPRDPAPRIRHWSRPHLRTRPLPVVARR